MFKSRQSGVEDDFSKQVLNEVNYRVSRPLGEVSNKKKKNVEFSTLLDRIPPPYYIVSVENNKKKNMV